MAKEQAKFEEIGRVRVSPTTEAVVSIVSKVDPTPDNPNNMGVTGININNFVTTERYTGYTRGVFIPTDKVVEFQKLVSSI